MKTNEKTDKIILILVIVFALAYLTFLILKPDEEIKTINHEINKATEIQVSSKEIRAKYVDENNNILLPGSYIRFNPNIIFEIELISDNKAEFYPRDINGFLYNGYYEVFKIDNEETRTTFKEKAHGSHAILPYTEENQDNICYEVVFYYDKIKFPEEVKGQEIEITDEIINKMPNLEDLKVYSYLTSKKDGTTEKREEIITEIPFILEPETIDKDILKYIDYIAYQITMGENAGKGIIKTDETVAEILFKIIDGKYIFDDWNTMSNDIELLQTDNDGKVALAGYSLDGINFHQLIVLKNNIIVPDKDKLKINMILNEEFYLDPANI